MALKGQKTTTGYIQWDNLMQLIFKLQRDKEHKFALLIAMGAFTGLRISDILSLRWDSILEKEILSLDEKKTKKHRKLKINSDLQEIICTCYKNMDSPELNEFVFVNKYGTKQINVQWVNVKLKEIFLKYGVKTNNASTHSLRKSFGRTVWQKNNYSEKSLVLLSEIFNHSSIQVTKKYLGIKEEEIFDVYNQLSF
jgi:integrase